MTDLVEVTVKIPKNVYEFYKALHQFKKVKVSVAELMGEQITSALQMDINNGNPETHLNVEDLIEAFNLEDLKEN